MTIQLPAETEVRLERIARRTGRSKAELAREAVLEFIENQEDIRDSRTAIKEAKEKGTTPWETLKVELGL